MSLDPEAQAVVDNHITRVKVGAEQHLSTTHGQNPTTGQVAQAVADVAGLEAGVAQKSFLRATFESVPGLAFVAAVMAIIFGVLAYYSEATERTQWLDIVKVFAGAVVGAAGTAATRRPPTS